MMEWIYFGLMLVAICLLIDCFKHGLAKTLVWFGPAAVRFTKNVLIAIAVVCAIIGLYFVVMWAVSLFITLVLAVASMIIPKQQPN